MMPRDLSDEVVDLFRRYEEKFGEPYPYSYVALSDEEAKKDMEERLKDGGEPIPDSLWKPTYESWTSWFKDEEGHEGIVRRPPRSGK